MLSIVKVFRLHMPLLIMIAGAVGLMLSTILLKSTLSATDFGLFALLVTYVSIVFSFGLLGAEQYFLRVVR
ncbi:MAG: hypothetical protein Q8J78_10155, partial [Moraxellaceae bacterium]|nr:hypothetical protein [Moraxellaceae bacterium]